MDSFQIKLTSGETRKMIGIPDTCPFCFQKITPNIYIGTTIIDHNIAEVFMKCPNTKCNKTFIGNYSFDSYYGSYNLNGLSFLQNLNRKSFNDTITEVSPSFESIYNQAFQAEQMELIDICGIGYRKALEFLIKDYLISKHPEKEEDIKKALLGNCIKQWIDNPRLKKVAERAVWLGNDETHYIRKWESKSIHDLKTLIDITVSYLEAELLADKYEAEMPN
ncbi:hypothetical protein ABID42_002201 [Arcicella rosea]|uniref:hypothetical protein n=1 Tax=Arcicella rosea TaxID=502909 RepID=UPI00345C701A